MDSVRIAVRVCDETRLVCLPVLAIRREPTGRYRQLRAEDKRVPIKKVDSTDQVLGLNDSWRARLHRVHRWAGLRVASIIDSAPQAIYDRKEKKTNSNLEKGSFPCLDSLTINVPRCGEQGDHDPFGMCWKSSTVHTLSQLAGLATCNDNLLSRSGLDFESWKQQDLRAPASLLFPDQ